MTEQEMLEALDDIWTFGHEPTDSQREAARMAMDALEEIQQYRAIGTVKEFQELKEISFSGIELAGIAVGMMMLKKYEAIGTVEECREAREKQKEKKPINVHTEGLRYTDTYRCPSCGGNFSGTGIADYCYHCGQRLDWSEE